MREPFHESFIVVRKAHETPDFLGVLRNRLLLIHSVVEESVRMPSGDATCPR